MTNPQNRKPFIPVQRGPLTTVGGLDLRPIAEATASYALGFEDLEDVRATVRKLIYNEHPMPT